METPTENNDTPQEPLGDGCMTRLVRPLKCFACSREFTDTDKLAMHEHNDHPNEYHAAMVREMYGSQDGYDFEPNRKISE